MTTWVHPWADADGAARAAALFEESYGYAPTGVWAAPGRVNIIGEHVDYNGGLVLPIALPHRTYIAFSPRMDREARVRSAREEEPWTGSLDEIRPGGMDTWAAYVVGVAWALEQDGFPAAGFDAAVESCVPYGAGLSSSAALECATAIALTQGADIPRTRLAAACIRAENEIAGANTGGMDQHASLFAHAGQALLFDTQTVELQGVPFDLAARGLELLVIDTKAPHALVDGQYAARRATCEEAARALGVTSLRDVRDLPAALAALPGDLPRRRVRHVVTEIQRVRDFVTALQVGDMPRAGALMNESHESLRVDYEVSCPELDTAVAAAVGAGALGARMTGGGFGGSAIALVAAGTTGEVSSAVEGAFADAGFHAPEFLMAPPSEAAEQVV